MKVKVSEVYNLMIKDATRKPAFLNIKKQEDKIIRESISSIIVELTALIKPYVLAEKAILDITIAFEFEWEIIEQMTGNLMLYFSILDYFNNLFKKWIELAAAEEEYETAENLRKMKQIIDARTNP